MLNKLSYNLMSALNEAEEVEVKKTKYTTETYLNENCKVNEAEIDGIELNSDEEAQLNNIMNTDYDSVWDELDDKEKAKYKEIANSIRRLKPDEAFIDIEDEIKQKAKENNLEKDILTYIYLNKRKLNEDDNLEDTKELEERLASLKTQLEIDGEQLADDEKIAIQQEIADLEAQLDGINESEQLNETGEWDDNDDDLIAWKEAMREAAKQIALNVGGEVKSVHGFDKYQGPYAIIATPKHGDVVIWFDEEDGIYNVRVAHTGWISGGMGDISEWLNMDTIPEEYVRTYGVNESEKLLKESTPGTEAYYQLLSGDDIFFRDEDGQALLGHYADHYPEPEEYDEGYITGWNKGEDPEYDKKQEEKFRKAKEAAEVRDVWEFRIVDENTLQPTGEIYAIAYGQDELMDLLGAFRRVDKVTKLEEGVLSDLKKKRLEKKEDKEFAKARKANEKSRKLADKADKHVEKAKEIRAKKAKLEDNKKNESVDEEIAAAREDSKEKGLLSEAVFEIDYAPDGEDLSTENAVIDSVNKWLDPIADAVEVKVVELNGPSGWPVVRLSGNKEEIADFLYSNYNSGEDSLEDIIKLHLVNEDEKIVLKPSGKMKEIPVRKGSITATPSIEREMKNHKKSLKEDSYDSGIFYEIEQAFEEAGLRPIRFIDDGILTRNIGWTVTSDSGQSQQISCDGSWYDEDEDEDLDESEKLNESAVYRGTENPSDYLVLSDSGELEKTSAGEVIDFGKVCGFNKVNNTTYLAVKDGDAVYLYSVQTGFPFKFDLASVSESEKSLKEAYSERYGGDPKNFIDDLMSIKAKLEEFDLDEFGTKLGAQVVMDFLDTIDSQIEMTKTKLETEPSMQESEEPVGRKMTKEEFHKEFGDGCDVEVINAGREPEERIEIVDECDTPIVEAEVKGLKEIKSQGNVYMLEDETNKFIVGENYNAEEGLIENAEIYDNRDEANKDYLGRCEITGGEEVVTEAVEEHDLSKDILGDEANKRAAEDQRAYEKYLALAKEVKDGKNDTITLDSAKQLLKNAYIKAKGYYSFEPEEIDKRIAKDIPELFGNTLKESSASFNRYGLLRAPEGDFSDDGNRFRMYKYNGIPITYLKKNGEVFLSIRLDYLDDLSYDEYSKLPSYKDCNKYNGVPESELDLADVVEICKRIKNEYKTAVDNK